MSARAFALLALGILGRSPFAAPEERDAIRRLAEERLATIRRDKRYLDSLAVRRPLVSGAAIRMEGQLAVFRNDLDSAACYRCLYDEDGEELEDCAGGGILGPVAGVIGSMMAVEALKLIMGAGPSDGDRLLLYDAMDGAWRSLALRPDPACPACARFRSR